jgi:drug/metabolite transporter (DMT)-like permease
LQLPKGLISSAAQMLVGGLVVVALALLREERIAAVPSARAVLALAYLIVFGSIVAYTAYQFLLSQVRPTLAASYAYVNPVVALGLGAALAGETVAPQAVGALALILGGVAMLALRRQAA